MVHVKSYAKPVAKEKKERTSVVLIEILMNAGEILRNVKLIFSRYVGCSKGGSNFSQRVLRQHGTSASGPPAVPN